MTSSTMIVPTLYTNSSNLVNASLNPINSSVSGRLEWIIDIPNNRERRVTPKIVNVSRGYLIIHEIPTLENHKNPLTKPQHPAQKLSERQQRLLIPIFEQTRPICWNTLVPQRQSAWDILSGGLLRPGRIARLLFWLIIPGFLRKSRIVRIKIIPDPAFSQHPPLWTGVGTAHTR